MDNKNIEKIHCPHFIWGKFINGNEYQVIGGKSREDISLFNEIRISSLIGIPNEQMVDAFAWFISKNKKYYVLVHYYYGSDLDWEKLKNRGIIYEHFAIIQKEIGYDTRFYLLELYKQLKSYNLNEIRDKFKLIDDTIFQPIIIEDKRRLLSYALDIITLNDNIGILARNIYYLVITRNENIAIKYGYLSVEDKIAIFSSILLLLPNICAASMTFSTSAYNLERPGLRVRFWQTGTNPKEGLLIEQKQIELNIWEKNPYINSLFVIWSRVNNNKLEKNALIDIIISLTQENIFEKTDSDKILMEYYIIIYVKMYSMGVASNSDIEIFLSAIENHCDSVSRHINRDTINKLFQDYYVREKIIEIISPVRLMNLIFKEYIDSDIYKIVRIFKGKYHKELLIELLYHLCSPHYRRTQDSKLIISLYSRIIDWLLEANYYFSYLEIKYIFTKIKIEKILTIDEVRKILFKLLELKNTEDVLEDIVIFLFSNPAIQEIPDISIIKNQDSTTAKLLICVMNDKSPRDYLFKGTINNRIIIPLTGVAIRWESKKFLDEHWKEYSLISLINDSEKRELCKILSSIDKPNEKDKIAWCQNNSNEISVISNNHRNERDISDNKGGLRFLKENLRNHADPEILVNIISRIIYSTNKRDIVKLFKKHHKLSKEEQYSLYLLLHKNGFQDLAESLDEALIPGLITKLKKWLIGDDVISYD